MTKNEFSQSEMDEFNQVIQEISSKANQLMQESLEFQQSNSEIQKATLSSIGHAFQEWMDKYATIDPQRIFDAQMMFWKDYMLLIQNTMYSWMGNKTDPVVNADRSDRRFSDEEWENNPYFSFIKQAYLLTSRHIQETVSKVDGMNKHSKQLIDFYTKQFIDAMAPTNFVMTNPEVLRETIETRGENLLHGMRNLLSDLERGHGQLRIKMTDLNAFGIGKNLALTPGKVIFQNDMIQLIQYTSTTEKVYKRPFLIVPPWINKFYILDLQEKNSFVKWLVDQGHTVFLISWVNPDTRHSNKGFEDYMKEGPLTALDVVLKATGEKDVNALGFCIGGTMLAATLAYMAEKNDKRIHSATFLTTLLDFANPGDISVFIDDEQISALEHQMTKTGFLDGGNMAQTFNLLRSNDLIWSFFVNNYLRGQEPFPFDILYWNGDSTNMPAKMHSMYLRKMYLENKLREPGGIVLDGVSIDLSRITIPAYFMSTEKDHIAPWDSTYVGAKLLKGDVTFTLAGSGHVAGVTNSPIQNKYGHRICDEFPATADEWYAQSKIMEGSWWPHWAKWLGKLAGEKIPAREPGCGKYKVIEDAPGHFVKVTLNDIHAKESA